MKRFNKLATLLLCLTMVCGLSVCIADEDEDEEKGPLTWDGIARFIDYQLGQISQGTALPDDCNGEGLNIGAGQHCKNRLAGTATVASVAQLVRLMNDVGFFLGDVTNAQGPEPFLFGFAPQTQDPCSEDVDFTPGIDVYATCNNGAAQIKCQDTGEFDLVLTYDTCEWQEGTTVWVLTGSLTWKSFSTDNNETVTVIKANNFTIVDNATNTAISFTGNLVLYQMINPLTGEPATGTSGPGTRDGMVIINMVATVDMNGDGTPDAPPYNLNLAIDYEDGLTLLSSGLAVWPENPTSMVGLTFFANGLPWNQIGPGCKVDIVNLDLVNRTFDIQSLDSSYPILGCMRDQVGVSY